LPARRLLHRFRRSFSQYESFLKTAAITFG
jgi:hypothetical protein